MRSSGKKKKLEGKKTPTSVWSCMFGFMKVKQKWKVDKLIFHFFWFVLN